jgi:hypothetical protein
VTEGVEVALQRQGPDRVCRRKLDGEQAARLVAVAWSEPPTGHHRWTLRLRADHLVEVAVTETVSYETVRQTFKPTGSSRG